MHEQQRLLDLIWNDDAELLAESGFDIQGITIYRRNLFANAQRALSITLPTIFKLLDSDISDHLVEHFLKLHPPTHGDWGQWGELFADFIATQPIASEFPYLIDCAQLDWHVHCALKGKDESLQQASLALLGDTDPENITIVLNDNVAFIETNYPIDDIFYAHHHEDAAQRDIAMASAQQALALGENRKTIMISRPAFQPQVTLLSDAETVFMQAVKAGQSLATCLNLIKSCNSFSFEKWLLTALEQNLIYQFKRIKA